MGQKGRKSRLVARTGAAWISQDAHVHCAAAAPGESKLNVADEPSVERFFQPPKPFKMAVLLNASPLAPISLETMLPLGAAQSVPPQKPSDEAPNVVKAVVVRLLVVDPLCALAPIGSVVSAPVTTHTRRLV